MKTAQIKRLLPSAFQTAAQPGNPLSAILDVMETMQAPSESVLDHLEVFFDPHRAPEAFVPYLASWVDLEGIMDSPNIRSTSRTPSLSTGLGRLRELTAAAVSLSHWRGTRKGLCLFLETATGMSGFEIDEAAVGSDGKIIPFHLHITAPAGAADHRILVERIIELEKPAYVTYNLEFTAQPQSPAATT
jgi:phage tail-like protein